MVASAASSTLVSPTGAVLSTSFRTVDQPPLLPTTPYFQEAAADPAAGGPLQTSWLSMGRRCFEQTALRLY